ncbi:hypothetical protein HII31_04087 [Pseudocercospora fuligena]|uniref:SnoaL-like domain-containing protein n=1 Tax=Pseudocercospora fuligena TaxID=685502 RepID=A0A8H6RLH2_9PEZI|nr:hypothetical protein HII31_04087 [Pseudocercospora fuligena]
MSSKNHIQTLRTTSHSFCKALESPPAPKDLLSKFFTTNPKVTEHGPEWARSRLPFLSKTYTGKDEFLEYFSTLSSILSMKMDPAPPMSSFAVDEAGETVFVQGGGEFESVRTGKAWKEKFVYRFSEFGEEGKIGHWEIWADPLSAWEAVGGD